MIDLNNHLAKYTLKHSNKISKLIDPLTRISGIQAVFRYTLSTKGEFTFIGNYPEWNEEYFANQYFLENPFLTNPRFMNPGSYFSHLLKGKQPNYQKAQDLRRTKINLDHNLICIEKIDNGIEAFGFCTFSENIGIYSFYHNQKPLLKTFMSFFKQELSSEISSMNYNKANLTRIQGHNFFRNLNNFIETAPISQEKLMAFNRSLGLKNKLLDFIGLTEREKQIALIVKQGQTAANIANDLYLSIKTVETHIANIKSKLNCSKKSDLIKYVTELEQLGFVKQLPD